MQRPLTGEDRRFEEGLFRCGRLQSRGVKQENFADKPCFNVFHMFRWNNTVIPGAGWAARTPRARMNSKKNHVTKKMSTSTVRSRLILRGAVESLTISD